MAKKYLYQLEIIDPVKNERLVWDLESEYEMMHVTIIDSKWKLDERTVMKKICDLLNIDKYNPLSLNCDAIFFFYRVDNDPPVFIPNDLADEILNLS